MGGPYGGGYGPSGGRGYAPFGAHPWHHYFAGGTGALVELSGLVFVLVLLAAACWAGRGAVTLLSRRRRGRPAPSPRAATGSAVAAQRVLASDSEREATTRLVSHAVGEGRLSTDEAGLRIDAALRARYRDELSALVADLPPLALATSARRFDSATLRFALLAVGSAAVLAAVLAQAFGGLWELWPVAVATLGASALLARR